MRLAGFFIFWTIIMLALWAFNAEPASAKLIVGNGAGNHLVGTPSADRILGRGGPDDIEGHGGPDTIRGGPGDDYLWGNGGNDRIVGSSDGLDYDVCKGGPGRDTFINCSFILDYNSRRDSAGGIGL